MVISRLLLPPTSYRLPPRSGFTLIELLVTVGIITLLVTGALVSFRSAGQHQALTSAAEELRSAILSARALALAPAATKAPGSPGYRLTTGGDRAWSITELPAPLGSARVVLSGQLGDQVSYQSPGSLVNLDFLIENRGGVTVASGSVGEVRISLAHHQSGEVMTLVLITATGQVEVTEAVGSRP